MFLKLKQNLPAIILFLFFAFLYIYTAVPGVYDGDSGEIAAAVNQLGLAHPTGFPLYMFSGKLFTLLVPIRDVAYRLNIFSSLLTASALVFFYYTLKNLDNSSFSSITASFILGLGRNTIWSNAGTARVYALSLLFASILFFIFSKWRKKQKTNYLYLYGFTWGLSMGTHALMLTMAIPFIYMLWQARRVIKERISILAKTILLTLIPAIQYLYLFFAYKRNTTINWGDLSSWDGFVYYITQRQYANKFFATDFSGFFSKLGSLLTGEFTIIFFPIVIIGLIVLYRKDRKLFIMLTATGLINIVIMLGYGKESDLPLLFRYLFIIYLLLAVITTFGLDFLASQIKEVKSVRLRFALLFGIIFGLVLIPAKANFRLNNRHQNYIVVDLAANILKTVPPNALLITAGDNITGSLWYLQSLEHRRDIIIVSRGLLERDWYVKNLNQNYPDTVSSSMLDIQAPKQRLVKLVSDNIASRPVYLTFLYLNLNSLFSDYHIVPEGITYGIRVNPPDITTVKTRNEELWQSYALRNLDNFNGSPIIEANVNDYAVALNNLAFYYNNVGLLDEAQKVLEQALTIPSVDQSIVKKNLEAIAKKKLNKK